VTRVAVLAASAVLRAGLASLLGDRSGLVVVGAEGIGTDAEGVETAFDRVAGWDADVVLWVVEGGHEPLDALLRRAGVRPPPGSDHGGATLPPDGSDGESASAPAVVLLADRGAPLPAIAGALRAGARAVLPADVAAATLALAVEAVAAGLTVLPPAATDALLGSIEESAGATIATRPGGAMGRPTLSAREREVLALLAEGLANKVIAPRLGISEHTVKAHVAAIFEKLGTGTRAEAVVTAARLGLLLL
jgi:DNA-binding NarL/FixJ family response regulator